ncbi:MAG TPA: hypothetical protein VFM93_12950 [Candidatus Limnocylindria bacterium]|nr:hypothetical protein [Candidatus Limnocylindria bacterium]
MGTAEATAGLPVTANRRRRGVLGGAVLMAVGLAFFLPPLGVENASSYLFLALGLAFAVAYVTSLTPYVYLVPATTLLGLGLGLLIPDWLRLPNEVASIVFLACLAIGFAAAYLIRPQRRWPLIPAGVLATVALVELFGPGVIVPTALQPFFVPSVLVAVGAYLIVGPRGG